MERIRELTLRFLRYLTTLLNREVVYGHLALDELVFVAKARALEIEQIYSACLAKTWSEFKGAMPAMAYEALLRDHYSDAVSFQQFCLEEGREANEESWADYRSLAPGERLPLDDDVPEEHLPWEAEGCGWPAWPQHEAFDWVPSEIQKNYGEAGYTPDGEVLSFSAGHESALVAAFERLGYQCSRDERLVHIACGALRLDREKGELVVHVEQKEHASVKQLGLPSLQGDLNDSGTETNGVTVDPDGQPLPPLSDSETKFRIHVVEYEGDVGKVMELSADEIQHICGQWWRAVLALVDWGQGAEGRPLDETATFVYGVPSPALDGSALVLMPEKEAQRLAAIRRATAMATTWGDFAAAVPKEDWRKLLHLFFDNGEILPTSAWPFEAVRLPGLFDGDWLEPKVLEWRPFGSVTVPGFSGSVTVPGFNGYFLAMDVNHMLEIVRSLERLGQVCRRDDELVRVACGDGVEPTDAVIN